jgi:hypothetical protein
MVVLISGLVQRATGEGKLPVLGCYAIVNPMGMAIFGRLEHFAVLSLEMK